MNRILELKRDLNRLQVMTITSIVEIINSSKVTPQILTEA